MPTEKDLQLFISKRAHGVGMLCYKLSSPSTRGVPDLMLVTAAGKVFFIEVKHPNGKGRLSVLQDHIINEFKERGVTVYVVDNRDHANEVIARELDQ